VRKVATDPPASTEADGSAVRDGGPIPPAGVSASVGREGRQVDGLEGNFEVMDPGIPLNGN
jgi:hypothetical protein